MPVVGDHNKDELSSEGELASFRRFSVVNERSECKLLVSFA